MHFYSGSFNKAFPSISMKLLSYAFYENCDFIEIWIKQFLNIVNRWIGKVAYITIFSNHKEDCLDEPPHALLHLSANFSVTHWAIPMNEIHSMPLASFGSLLPAGPMSLAVCYLQ
jgi:hypothetical protein